MSFKEHLKALRRAKGLSGYAVAKRGGITPTQLAAIENGINKNPGLRMIRALLKGLDVTPNELLAEDRSNIECPPPGVSDAAVTAGLDQVTKPKKEPNDVSRTEKRGSRS